VQRLLDEHEDQRRAFAMPPLSGDALERVMQAFRLRAAVSVPFDPTPRWSNVRELENEVRDAEDALERAKADANREARLRHATAPVELAQRPARSPFEWTKRLRDAH
jgi:hypothetical protein